MFLAAVHESGRVRVVGVDGRVGPAVDSAMDQLCASGWIERSVCNSLNITYETTNAGRGWYYFHHHHLHISFSSRRNFSRGGPECLVEGCPEMPPVKFDPRTFMIERPYGRIEGPISPLR